MYPKVRPIHSAPVEPQLHAPVWLPPGETELAVISYQVGKQYNRGVVTVWFKAVEFGGVVVPAYYNVRMKGKRAFAAPRGSRLVADFRRLFCEPLGRLDRFPMHWLKGRSFIGEIGTVTTDSEQNAREDGAEYSVVRKLVKCI